MGLPVLRLPSLVFDSIYQFLNVSDIILLSQCSRTARDLVRSQEGPRTGRQVAICFRSEYTRVQVVRRINDCSCRPLFALEVRLSVRNSELTDEKSFFDLNIEGTTLNVKKCPPVMVADWYCFSDEKAYEKDVLIIVKMLRNLFNCSIFNIDYTLKNANFQKLFVETDALHRADNIYVYEDKYDPKDMDFMFDHFLTDHLHLRGYGGPKYSYRKPLAFPKIYLNHAIWIHDEKLLEMAKSSRNISLHGARLISDIDINRFIKWWLTSDNKTLEFLTIDRGQCLAPPLPGARFIMNSSVITEGIKSTPGKKKRNEATENWYRIKWEHGVDITRKDGIRATILVNHQTPYDILFFTVWHHPNPDAEEVIDK